MWKQVLDPDEAVLLYQAGLLYEAYTHSVLMDRITPACAWEGYSWDVLKKRVAEQRGNHSVEWKFYVLVEDQ